MTDLSLPPSKSFPAEGVALQERTCADGLPLQGRGELRERPRRTRARERREPPRRVAGVVKERTRNRRTRDRGASAIEFAGMLPLLLLVAVAAIQLGIVGYAVQQAGTGARAAARTATHEDTEGAYEASGRAAMSGWTAKRASFALAGGGEEVKVTTTVTIPSLIPGLGNLGEASRSATMPRD